MMSLQLQVLLIIPIIIVMGISLFGNVILLDTICNEKRFVKKTPFIHWVTNLVVSDLILTLVVMPLTAGAVFGSEKVFTPVVKSVITSLAVFVLSATSWTVLVNSTERYRFTKEIVKGRMHEAFKGWSHKNWKPICAGIWIWAALISTIIHWCPVSYRNNSILKISMCGDHRNDVSEYGSNMTMSTGVPDFCYVATSMILCYIIPALIIVLLSALTMKRIIEMTDEEANKKPEPPIIRRIGGKFVTDTPPDLKEYAFNARHLNRTLTWVTLCFISSWTPLAVLALVSGALNLPGSDSVIVARIYDATIWLLWLGFLNSALIPVVYAVSWREFRHAMMKRVKMRIAGGWSQQQQQQQQCTSDSVETDHLSTQQI